MSARKKATTANPVLDGMVDVPPAPQTVRCRVRLKSGGPERRCRAGHCFGHEPVDLEMSPEGRAALEADAWLMVEVLS